MSPKYLLWFNYKQQQVAGRVLLIFFFSLLCMNQSEWCELCKKEESSPGRRGRGGISDSWLHLWRLTSGNDSDFYLNIYVNNKILLFFCCPAIRRRVSSHEPGPAQGFLFWTGFFLPTHAKTCSSR